MANMDELLKKINAQLDSQNERQDISEDSNLLIENSQQPDLSVNSGTPELTDETINLPYSPEKNEQAQSMQKQLPVLSQYSRVLENQIAKLKDNADILQSKIDKQNQKLAKLENKLEGCQYRKDFFEYIQKNNVLPGVNGILTALIANEVRKSSLLSEKIPLRKEKIEALTDKLEKKNYKIERKTLRLESTQKLSVFIKNFVNLNSEERRQTYVDCIRAFNKLNADKNSLKINKLQAKADELSEKLSDNSLTNIERLKIDRKLNKVNLKIQSIKFSLSETSQNAAESTIKAAEKNAEVLDAAIQESVSSTHSVLEQNEPENMDFVVESISDLSLCELNEMSERSINHLREQGYNKNEKGNDGNKTENKVHESTREKIQKMQEQIRSAQKSVEKAPNKDKNAPAL